VRAVLIAVVLTRVRVLKETAALTASRLKIGNPSATKARRLTPEIK